MRKVGDYVIWPPNVEHHLVVQESAELFVVRWPSLPDDQEKGDGSRW
jgi:quercetin dioxygenase-like cupin family protein